MEGKIPIETSPKVDYDKLVGQNRVDALFKPLGEKYEDHKEEIEELKFLFKNCCYNESRLMGEIERSRKGFGFPDDETKKKIAQSMGLKEVGDGIEIGLPTTLWSDILTFEVHALLSNIIRCCTYLTKFKMRNLDGLKNTRNVSVGKYYYWEQKEPDKIKDKGELHKFVIEQCKEWIKKVNKIRNEIIHERIVRGLNQDLIFIWKIIPGGSVETKGNIKLAIPEYNIDNLEEYVVETMGRLESFVREFFEKFASCQ